MKKPFLHSLAAALYIVLLVSMANLLSSFMPKEDNIFMPMTMLGLLVLSVAVMGYLFIYEPLVLYAENKKREALVFFSKTVGFFALFVAIFIVLILVI